MPSRMYNRLSWGHPCALAVLIVTAFASTATSQTPAFQTKAIATINGTSVVEADVRIDGPSYRHLLDTQRRLDGKTPLTDLEFTQAKVKYECLQLSGLLWDAVCNGEIARRGLTITDEEAMASQKDSLQGRDLDKDAVAIRARSKALVLALEEVKEGVRLDEAYREHLKDQNVDHLEWELMAQKPDTYLAGLRKTSEIVGVNLVEDVSRFKGFSNLQKKLYRIVDEEIGRTDAQFRKYAETLSHGSAPLVYDEYVAKKRRAWWTQRYAELNVTLYDQELERECQIQKLGVVAGGPQQ